VDAIAAMMMKWEEITIDKVQVLSGIKHAAAERANEEAYLVLRPYL
jgi:hypothetical protein